MGLDNGFLLRNKKHKNQIIEVAYFRKFYELDTYIGSNYSVSFNDEEYEWIVDEDLLKNLLKEISPIVEELSKLSDNEISYYDENGYPETYEKIFYDMEFDPTHSRSAFAGYKTLKLYSNIKNMLEILELNNNGRTPEDNEYFITFYSSF